MENTTQPFESISQEERERLEKAFSRYMNDFGLSEEDLRSSILDVGVNKGDFVNYIRKIIGNTQAYGVEMYESKISDTSEGIIQASGLELPFENESFKTVLARNYISMFYGHHDNLCKTLSELIRTAKSGGKIYFDVSTPEGVLKGADEYREKGIKLNEEYEKRRYEGAQKLYAELDNLSADGFVINQREKPHGGAIITIEKP